MLLRVGDDQANRAFNTCNAHCSIVPHWAPSRAFLDTRCLAANWWRLAAAGRYCIRCTWANFSGLTIAGKALGVLTAVSGFAMSCFAANAVPQ